MKTIPFDPNDKQMLASIHGIPAFKPLQGARLIQVMQMVTINDYDKKEEVMTQGEVDRKMYFLLKGKLSVQVDGIEVNALDKPYTAFGEMGIIDKAPRSASVVVKRPARCLALDISFWDRLEGRAKLAVQAFFYKMFYDILSQRLRETNERIADLEMQRTVMENMEI